MIRAITRQAGLAAVLGASLLLAGMATPDAADAREGKWWTPKQGNRDGRRVDRVVRRERSPRFSRQYRSYGGQRVYRDMVVIRDVNRGPRYRAWRAYSRPYYIHARRVIRVRPARLYVAAVIGGVSVRGRYHDDYLYGCNFCEARFHDYGGYHGHVVSCSHRPHGYRIECSDWNAPSSAGWWDDREWRDDGYHAYDRDYRDYRDYDDDRVDIDFRYRSR